MNDVIKTKEKMELKINDRNVSLLTSEEEVADRWNEYFEELLNVAED